jgi:hypothetical protein
MNAVESSSIHAAKPPWQFSLRQLLFMTSSVACLSALESVANGLATVMVVPAWASVTWAVLCVWQRRPSTWPVALACFTSFLAMASFGCNTPRDAWRRSHCKQNLKEIAMALHNYHDRFGCFPPAYLADAAGKPTHSWRVLILPFLDYGKPIYDAYSFDESWDGPKNRRLHNQISYAFKCPSDNSRGSADTSYVAVVGPHVAWPGASSRRLDEFGTADSILVVEVCNSGIHWMEPRDLDSSTISLEINPKVGRGICSQHTAGAHICIFDGSVRFLSNRVTARELGPLLRIEGNKLTQSTRREYDQMSTQNSVDE